MKNLRTVYLSVFLACVLFSFISSINVAPQTSAFSISGWVFGFNLTHNLVIKVIGFVALGLYFINPKFGKNESSTTSRNF